MNDRLKFRVWDIRNREYFKDPVPPLNSDGTLAFQSSHPDFQKYYITEFCTGLKDNCGNLIYEGDIIGDGEDDYVIKWDSNRTMFVAEDVDTSYEIEDVLDPTICVIGNIHEQAGQKDMK